MDERVRAWGVNVESMVETESSVLDVDGIDDEEATEILAEVIGRMSPATPPDTAPTVEAWSDGFRRYVARGTEEIPPALIEAARRLYAELCESQTSVRLLHGDLHHHNVLLDVQRGLTLTRRGSSRNVRRTLIKARHLKINTGDSRTQKIGEAIDRTDFVAAVLSHNSVGSEWVQRELQVAVVRQYSTVRTT